MHWPPFTLSGRFVVLVSIEPRAIGRLERFSVLENLITSSGIKPETFRLVAECLNQLRYRVPLFHLYIQLYIHTHTHTHTHTHLYTEACVLLYVCP
jgi:hypothetical protein